MKGEKIYAAAEKTTKPTLCNQRLTKASGCLGTRTAGEYQLFHTNVMLALICRIVETITETSISIK